jgi:hypothetical protein
MITISVLDKSGNLRARTFDDVRAAAMFYRECVSRGIPKETLIVDNPTGVDFSVFNDRIPEWAQDLIVRLETEMGAGIGRHVPYWRFLDKSDTSGPAYKHQRYSTGMTYYNRDNTKYIQITRGYHNIELKGVIIHEYTHHLMGHDENHGRLFYNMMFDLLRIYCTREEEEYIVKAEFEYRKSSRWYYANKYYRDDPVKWAEITGYRQEEYLSAAAKHVSKEERAKQKQDKMIEDLFE